jgi:hypothetical protein
MQYFMKIHAVFMHHLAVFWNIFQELRGGTYVELELTGRSHQSTESPQSIGKSTKFIFGTAVHPMTN